MAMNHPAPPYVIGQTIWLPDGTKGMVSAVGAEGIWIWAEPENARFLSYGSELLARGAAESLPQPE